MKTYLKSITIVVIFIFFCCQKDPENLYLKPFMGNWYIKSYKIDGIESLVNNDSIIQQSLFLGVTCPNCNQTGGEGYYMYNYVTLFINTKNYFNISKNFSHNLANKELISRDKLILIGNLLSEDNKCKNTSTICTKVELNNLFLIRSALTKGLYWKYEKIANNDLILRTDYNNQKHEILLQ